MRLCQDNSDGQKCFADQAFSTKEPGFQEEVALEGLELPTAATRQPVRLAIRQQPAGTKGSATVGNRQVALEGLKISGESVRFSIPGLGAGGKPLVLEGVARGGIIEGTATTPGAPAPWRASRP